MNDFSEMICGTCMNEHDFLHHYTAFSVSSDENGKLNESQLNESAFEENPAALDDTATSVEVEQVDATAESAAVNTASPIPPTEAEFSEEINQCIKDIIEINKSGVGDDPAEDPSMLDAAPPTKKQKLNDASENPMPEESPAAKPMETDQQLAKTPNIKACRKPAYPTQKKSGATFWPHDWRLNLCDCPVCRIQMQRKRIEFLLDAEDTVLCYQEKGMAKVASGENTQHDVAMAALSSLGRSSQIDAIMGYNRLKEKLTEFLNAFAASRQVVTEEDIKRFFRMMKEKQGDEPKATLGGGRGGI